MDLSTSPLPAAVIATRLGLTGLATSAITGTLTLAKTGTTARTATFPDAAIEVQAVDEEKSSDFTARIHATYLITGTCTVTDPTPEQGHEYIVFVRNGTCTIGGVAYIAGQTIKRSFHSGSWSSVAQAVLSTAQSFAALQTFTAGLTVSAGTTALQDVTCTTLTASGSGVIGATALLASERLRVSGGTMGTPGATDVLVAAGKLYAGDTSATSIQTAGGITTKGLLSTVAGVSGTFDSGAASDSRLEFKRNGVRMGLFSWDLASMRFEGDTAAASWLYFKAGGADRLTISGSTGQVAVLPTTASTSTTTGALTVAGGVGVAKEIVLTDSATGAVYWGATTTTTGATRTYGNGSGAQIFEKYNGSAWVEIGRFA